MKRRQGHEYDIKEEDNNAAEFYLTYNVYFL